MSPPAPLPCLILITDWSLGRERMSEVLGEVLPLGPRVAVQHRHPDVGGRQYLEEARWLAARCTATGNPLFINGRLDVALLTGSHLHAPAHGPSARELRAHLPPSAWLSVAVHDEEEALGAQDADFALVSPLFAPGSKPQDARPPLGPVHWEALAKLLPCPAFALGGIDAEHASQVPARARGVAVVSALGRSSSPRSTAEALLSALANRKRESGT